MSRPDVAPDVTVSAGPVSDNRAIGGALAAACRELRPAEIAAIYEDQRVVGCCYCCCCILAWTLLATLNTFVCGVAAPDAGVDRQEGGSVLRPLL